MARGGHCHKYYRVDIGQRKPYVVYRCALPRCTHYLQRELITAKESICWECGERFIVTKANLNQEKLRCMACVSRHSGGKGGTPKPKGTEAIVTDGSSLPDDAFDFDNIDALVDKLGPKDNAS